VGKIRGGMQANIVPDQCTIDVERRLLPGDKPEQVLQSIQTVIDAMPEATSCRIEMELPDFVEHPMDTPEGADIVQGAAAACEAIMGRAEITGVPFGTDASDLAQSSIPTVVLGPGSIAEAHSAAEYVEIDQVAKAAEVYAELCIGFR
jgi:acetylornithine deacetylase